MDEITVQNSNPRKWYEIWIDAWSHPSVETFRRILKEPGVKVSRAFIWVAVTAIVSYVIYFLAYQATSSAFMRSSFPRVPVTTIWLCITILSPALAIAGISIMAAIYRWIASLLGGSGNWEHLVYTFAAISAPGMIISILFAALALVLSRLMPGASLCFSFLSLPLSIYAIVLYVSAIDAVERIGTGKAILSYFIPLIIVFLFVICLISITVIAEVGTR